MLPSIYKFSLSVCLFVLYPINVKTAEPIREKKLMHETESSRSIETWVKLIIKEKIKFKNFLFAPY